MANLSDLPPELLEMVLRFLGSIDDVHSLGRTCRKTYDVIRRPTVYVEIMRSVIGQAQQHRYDLQLCKMLHVHHAVVEHMQQHGTPLPATQPDPFRQIRNSWENSLASATTPPAYYERCGSEHLPDETIHDILARYQGLRVLEDLWLRRQLNASDYFSADESPDASALVHGYQVPLSRSELHREGELPTRRCVTPETVTYKKLNADQRGRFYSAVTYVWLMNEIRWLFTNFQYPARFDVQIELLETCKFCVSDQIRVPLLDELDDYALFRFMYHHLLPVYGIGLADQDIAKLPFTFSSEFSKDVGFSTRLLQLFMTAGQTYLQPPDLIDLIARNNAARRPPYTLIAFPETTRVWQRPSQAFTFSANSGLNLFDEGNKRLIRQASETQLNLIARSSFHQKSDTRSPTVSAPQSNDAYIMRDHASDYYLDRAMVAFEKFENRASDLQSIREVFPRKWEDTLWSVWWWANSEDKARAKMERWREEPAAPSADAVFDAQVRT